MIDTLHQALRSVHISVGSIGLILFWIPVFARKGSPSHRKIGQWFVCSVYVVSISALISCAWAWAHPASFLEQPELTAGAAKQLRFFTGILSLLAAMALSGAVLGPRVLRIKDTAADRWPICLYIFPWGFNSPPRWASWLGAFTW